MRGDEPAVDGQIGMAGIRVPHMRGDEPGRKPHPLGWGGVPHMRGDEPLAISGSGSGR